MTVNTSANNRLDVKTSGDMGNNVAFDPGYWSSTNYKVVDHNASHGKDTRSAIRNSSFTMSATNEEAFAQLMAVNNTYAMADHQIVEINEITSINFGYSFIGVMGDAVLEKADGTNATSNDYVAKLRIYVAGSDVPYYDIDHKWYQTIDVRSELPEGAHGYVTALQVFPMSYIPEGFNVQDNYKEDGTTAWGGRYVPGFSHLCSYNVVATEEIEDTFYFEGYLDGYKVLGLDTAKAYAYSTDNETWTNVPEGASFFTVYGIGTYYIKVLGQNGNHDSAAIEVTINGAQAPVTGLVYADGKITGLDADKNYEYHQITIFDAEWIAVPAGSTEIADITAGVW